MKGAVEGGGESVRVIVRLRPEEQEGGALAGGKDMAGSCVLGLEDQKLTVVDPRRRSSNGGGASGNGGGGDGGRRGEEQHQQAYDFSFDRVFGPEATQDDVFETVKPLVHATVDGELQGCNQEECSRSREGNEGQAERAIEAGDETRHVIPCACRAVDSVGLYASQTPKPCDEKCGALLSLHTSLPRRSVMYTFPASCKGFTTTVFAYGSTGSGKTHTISGTDEDPGVLPRAVRLLFERLELDMAAGSDKAFMVFLT